MTSKDIHIQACFNLTTTCRSEDPKRMTQGKKDSLIYHSQAKRDTVMQITDFHNILMRGKWVLHNTSMAKRDEAEYHEVQRQRKFTISMLEQCQRRLRRVDHMKYFLMYMKFHIVYLKYFLVHC